MKRVFNDTRCYHNQYFTVTDLKETKMNEKLNTCNVCSVGMIVEQHPDVILHYMYKTYGMNQKFMWESNLIKYLEDCGHECKQIGVGWKKRKVKDSELEIMRNAISDGKIVFYHKHGHYYLMVGFEDLGNGKYNYIFNDSAGDRKIARRKRNEESGHLVVYPEKMVKKEKIYGSCWIVTI